MELVRLVVSPPARVNAGEIANHQPSGSIITSYLGPSFETQTMTCNSLHQPSTMGFLSIGVTRPPERPACLSVQASRLREEHS